MEFFDPHAQIGEQEAQRLPIAVVEQTTAPQLMLTTFTRVEKTSVWERNGNMWEKINLLVRGYREKQPTGKQARADNTMRLSG